MMKLKLPKNPHTGMKIYCHRCKRDNPTCSHYDIHKFKIRIHISGTNNQNVTKVLQHKNYKDAVVEAIAFEKELKANNYSKVEPIKVNNDYSIAGAVVRYNQFLSGNYEFAQHIKEVSDDHKKECIRFCKYFCETLKGFKDLTQTRIVDVDKRDVGRFYKWAENHYESEKSFNKCLYALKTFFQFLIDVEEIEMKNPFKSYQTKTVIKKNVTTLTKDEFITILNSVSTANPYKVLGGKGERKNMFRVYLVNGFRLFLLTGGRREEIVELKWSDILITIEGVKFFQISNRKVNRTKHTDTFRKYIPINEDLFQLLNELGYQEKKNSSDYILFPERNVKSKTIMNDLSKAFSHYVRESNVKTDISLSNLRKT